MTYEFYKWFHFVGLLMVFGALGAVALYVANGGPKATWRFRRFAALMHGIGLAFLLVAGFGMMARKGFDFGTSHWIHVKLIVWLLLGVYPAILWRKPRLGRALFSMMIALGALAAFSAIYKF